MILLILMHPLSADTTPITVIKVNEAIARVDEGDGKGTSWRWDPNSPRLHPASKNKGTYFGGDPVRDVGLHGTDVLLGIIHRDKEISGLTINVIVKLKSV